MDIRGLTRDEVAERERAGLVNDYEPAPTRRTSVIILRNIFIIFNVLLAPLMAVLLVMGQYKDVISVGVVALINTLINIIQEIQAKRALDRIKMENPATACHPRRRAVHHTTGGRTGRLSGPQGGGAGPGRRPPARGPASGDGRIHAHRGIRLYPQAGG
jgi:magnesium-transporting ATPase (P-type)